MGTPAFRQGMALGFQVESHLPVSCLPGPGTAQAMSLSGWDALSLEGEEFAGGNPGPALPLLAAP